MLRRSILALSSRKCIRRIPRQIIAQGGPSIISSRNEFSTATRLNASSKPGPTGKPPESNSKSFKVLLGTALGTGAALAADQTGYLDKYIGKEKEKHKSHDLTKFNDEKNVAEDNESLAVPIASSTIAEEPNTSSMDQAVQNVETDKIISQPTAVTETQAENQTHLQDKPDSMPSDVGVTVEEKNMAKDYAKNLAPEEQSSSPPVSSEGSVEKESSERKDSHEPNEEVQVSATLTKPSVHPEKDEQRKPPHETVFVEDKSEDSLGENPESPASLLDEYHLRDDSLDGVSAKATEGLVNAIEDLNDGNVTKDGKLVLDFLQTIHAAEERQAELDARKFAEEIRALKDRYEKELRDSRARELMFTEEAAMLEKELKRERTKALANINALQEKMEEKLRTELEKKESEAELMLKRAKELAKAELAAAISREKAAQIEKLAEADLHINALCMAFYARSEEARRSYSAHKLALGALALEDALSKGLPIEKEIDALHTYLDGVEKDSILDLVLSSLPEEIRYRGTETLLQLDQKFDELKGTLRHFSLIPPGGGGILTHSLAHIASWLKVKEADTSGEGIESVIGKVESHLREGKLAEAADALEEGVRGSQAEEIVVDWVKRARNRAITEQGLTFLQSYATCLSLT